jgi:diacylglycerol kinase family enzyme
MSQRIEAVAALALFTAAMALLVIGALIGLPQNLIWFALLVLAAALAYQGAVRRGTARIVLLVASAVAVVAALGLSFTGDAAAEGTIGFICLAASLPLARRALRPNVDLPPATPPRRAIVVWNPKSGGGKAVKNDLAREAKARGIEPIELKPGDDLFKLVRDAVANGADGLAAAGGDGTQAIVASIAAEHDLPFACIPAGTRNHFALDLGVDRNDVVGALEAFVNGGERRVDLAEVNGRTFVNNVSLGLYAEAVQRSGYRDAKLRTILDTVPDALGSGQGQTAELRFTDGDGRPQTSAAVILVSNNAYRLGRLVGSGTRPSISDGVLSVAVMQPGSRLRQWSAPEFVVDSSGPVPVGVDGEALMLDPPLRFTIRPGVLRVRLAPHHPAASPSARLPGSLAGAIRAVARVAAGRT